MSIVSINAKRVITSKKYGRFYLMGNPDFTVIHAPDFTHPELSGYIVIEKDIDIASVDANNLHSLNRLFKMTERQLIPALFKSKEMAEEVCDMCNKAGL